MPLRIPVPPASPLFRYLFLTVKSLIVFPAIKIADMYGSGRKHGVKIDIKQPHISKIYNPSLLIQ
jgi:hypothetical protein